MLYPYQDKQTLCVTLEDTGEEAISKPVLNIIAFQPLLYVAVIAPLFLSYAAYMVHALGLDEPEEPLGQKRSIQYLLSIFQLPPHATWTLSVLPLMCVGLATLVALYMKLRTRAEREDIFGTTYAHLATFTPFSVACLAVELSVQAYKGREVPVWRYNVGEVMSGAICLTFLADVSFSFIHYFL